MFCREKRYANKHTWTMNRLILAHEKVDRLCHWMDKHRFVNGNNKKGVLWHFNPWTNLAATDFVLPKNTVSC